MDDERILNLQFITYNHTQSMNLQNYEILNKLGEGAFGVVYKARDKTTNMICVVKKINIEKMSSKMRKNAMQEGKILKQLNSPYIVKHYSSFVDKSSLNIVMEYCPKGDLAAFIKGQMGKPLKEEKVWKFSIQMMIGLRDIHAKKILHRDMKALNIFLDADGNVRIGDLGVAKEMKSDFAYTIVGTPYYLSPEMCEEKPYNEKTDIWAMGCIIYELCTGKHPFQANNQAALALKIVIGKYQNIPSHYSADLDWVVRSCLSVDYKRRPTAAHLLSKSHIIEKAKKLGISIDVEPQPREQQIKIETLPCVQSPTRVTKQPIKIGKQPLPPSAKKNLIGQNPVLSKKSTSGSGPRNSVQKRVSVEKKPEIPKNRVPPKIQKKPPFNIQLNKQAKKLSGAKIQELKQKQRKSHSRNKSSIVQSTPSNISSSNNFQKVQKIKQKPENEYNSIKSSPKKNSNNNFSTTMNRFLPQDFRKKKQFDYEDEHDYDKVQIPDSSSQSDEDDKKKNKIFQNAQKKVDDDQLMEEFGISPAKKENLMISQVKLQNKLKEINWDIDEQNPNKSKGESRYMEQKPMQNQSMGIKQPNLPTVKTPSYLEKETLKQMSMEEQEQNLLEEEQQLIPEEQIEENQPYISDEDQEPTKQEQIPVSNGQSLQKNPSRYRYAMQDYPEKQKKLMKKLQENQKRQSQLIKMKQHFQKQLFKIIPDQNQYNSIKQQLINYSGDDEAVEKFVNKWKGNIQSINLFYRIIHFEMELKRCLQNIDTIEVNLKEINKNM